MAEERNWLQGTKDYINELKLEMRKVTWPNRKQVEATTAVVIFSVFAFAAYFPWRQTRRKSPPPL